jgi:DNA-binding PadR family transcriptional regulator
MTKVQRSILEALAARAHDELYGLDLVAAGAASRMSLYVELSRLEDRGLVQSREEPPSAETIVTRRLYRITPAGAAMLLPTAEVRR